jgi:adenine-specific DNA-methyltransferase
MSSPFETNKRPADKQKLRGGYYTPVKLADYLVEWAIRNGTKRILEPSAGDGNFVLAILNHYNKLKVVCDEDKPTIVAVEVESDEVQKAQTRTQRINTNELSINWICDDFFAVYGDLRKDELFDVVLGNPPFIRFQYFVDESRNRAFEHLRNAGYKPTKLANAWVAFIQLSIELLEDGGRLAMVVPAELLQVKYSHELRTRLSKQFEHIVLVGFRKLVFPEIQQEVLLLLAEGKREQTKISSKIHTIQFDNGDELIRQGDLNTAIAHIPSKHSRNGMKWTALFLSNDSFEALDEAEQSNLLTPLGNLAEVDVGIVTGRNKFFVITEETKQQISASNFTVPIVGRTTVLNSPIFSLSDFEEYKNKYPAYLLNFTGIDASELPESILEYLRKGENERVHTGYKCRVRPRWYDVPSVYIPDAFLFRQVHKYPLLVVNEAQVTSTDTIHRVRLTQDVNLRLLATIFFNSLTLAWAEVGGRSYGGGVLELETREAEQLPIPYHENLNLDVEKVDTLLRKGKTEEALSYVDSIVLKEFLGFDTLMMRKIHLAWTQLRDRRIHRR